MANVAYQGDLLELQKVAFAWWKVQYEETQLALSKLKVAEKKIGEEKLEDTIDPLVYIQNLVRIKHYEQTKAFQAYPLNYKGELLELQNQIFGHWKLTDEYKRLLRVRKKKKKATPYIPRKLEWWEWIAVSNEYKQPVPLEKIVGLGNGPGDPDFRSMQYKTESSQARSHRWDNQTREAYQSLEYNSNLTDKTRLASQVDHHNVSHEVSTSKKSN